MTTERPGYADTQEKLLNRVKRLEGQVRGVGKMIEDDRYCIDIVNQLSAVQSAARELSIQLLEGHVRHCVTDAIRSNGGDEKVDELVTTLARAMGR